MAKLYARGTDTNQKRNIRQPYCKQATVYFLLKHN
jgi:hypothetical protein